MGHLIFYFLKDSITKDLNLQIPISIGFFEVEIKNRGFATKINL
jgi:hypothetical protein